MIANLRNIAIIAHVDHGKTTLVDQLLKQSGTLDARKEMPERMMDSNALERERGITILAKNTAIRWEDYRINIVDTPGHADFGGEVERVLSMVDSVLLLVDAVDGPMPQTRFVTQKAFDHGLKPIVVINKIDRAEARPGWVLDQTFDLFDRLGATEAQLDFPVVYASALQGFATLDPAQSASDMGALFRAIVQHCPAPDVDVNGPLQLQVSQLDYSSYVGAIGIGRIKRGTLRRNAPVTVIGADGQVRNERIGQILGFIGLIRVEVESAEAGDIVAFAGIGEPKISDTICDPTQPEALPRLTVDEPTISMTFEVNTSPFYGRDGKFVTSRQLRERLQREALHNVALRVEETDDPDKFIVYGRGELHLGVLLVALAPHGLEQHAKMKLAAAVDDELVGIVGFFHSQRHVVKRLALQALTHSCRLVTNLPSRPKKGEVFTSKVMLMVGSSTVRGGSASGCAGSQTVSEIFGSPMPAKATMSPACADSTSITAPGR